MCSKKKDLEIICNLQWKNKCYNGGERSNIVGVYDVPSTTLNWEIFKSYLLKNSGTPGDDVRVSYVSTNDNDIPILSQNDFQIALYSFRKKARNGEIINLKLDRISDSEKGAKKRIILSNDVQTQFDTNQECSHRCSMQNFAPPPLWFTDYMKEFKKDLLHEMSTVVSSYVSTLKNHNSHLYHARHTKKASSQARKNAMMLYEDRNEKENSKNSKIERKVESKLEKLENKSKKLKEKKISLLMSKSSDSNTRQTKSNLDCSFMNVVDTTKMNAAPVRCQQSVIPHLMGGEVYLHTWQVINNGSVPWTSQTELHFTWGSAFLEPVQRIVPCPPLKPGESGTINVLLNVPNSYGQYESYWHFYHRGRKFGHWLGCQIIVDKVNSAEPLTNSFLKSYEHLKSKYDSIVLSKNDISKTSTSQNDEISNVEQNLSDLTVSNDGNSSNENGQFIFIAKAPIYNKEKNVVEDEKKSCQNNEIEKVVLNASSSKIQIVESEAKDSNDVQIANNDQCDVESDDNNNNNTENIPDSPSTSISESISKIDEETSSNSTLNDMVLVNFTDELDEHDLGFAYVNVDGTKVPIPKKFLRTDYLETAEEAPDPKSHNEVISQLLSDAIVERAQDLTIANMKVEQNLEETPYSCLVSFPRESSINTSNCSEQNNKRKFVFPQNCPGYEITKNESDEQQLRMNWPQQSSPNAFTGYNFSASNTYCEPIESVTEHKPLITLQQTQQNVVDLSSESEQMVLSNTFEHVPNYQLTPPEMRKLRTDPSNNTTETKPRVDREEFATQRENSPTANAQMSAVVNGAMTMASTAFNTAKNVVNMIIPPRNDSEGDAWISGHWVTTDATTAREANLQTLAEMGFWDRDLNATLLARYNDDISLVVSTLIQ